MRDEPDAEMAREVEDVRLQIVHARQQLRDKEQQRKDARRQYARDYYAAHREEWLEYQRQQRLARREADPDRYRELQRERNRRWRATHREEHNAKMREKYHVDPEKHRERRRQQYAANAEELRARRREYYAKNKQRADASSRAWRDREKRRREAGLPPRRLHRLPLNERLANSVAADDFFARTWTDAELDDAVASLATPPELVAAFKRDCLRARTTFRLAEQKEELARLQKELGRTRPGPKPKPRPTPEQLAEEARLDAIGQEVNERLRHREPPRNPHHLDPAAPHPMLQAHHTMGMNQ